MPASMPAQSHRQLPEWQTAQADYIAEHGDPDNTAIVRIAAACRMREIERAWSAGCAGPRITSEESR